MTTFEDTPCCKSDNTPHKPTYDSSATHSCLTLDSSLVTCCLAWISLCRLDCRLSSSILSSRCDRLLRHRGRFWVPTTTDEQMNAWTHPLVYTYTGTCVHIYMHEYKTTHKQTRTHAHTHTHTNMNAAK